MRACTARELAIYVSTCLNCLHTGLRNRPVISITFLQPINVCFSMLFLYQICLLSLGLMVPHVYKFNEIFVLLFTVRGITCKSYNIYHLKKLKLCLFNNEFKVRLSKVTYLGYISNYLRQGQILGRQKYNLSKLESSLFF